MTKLWCMILALSKHIQQFSAGYLKYWKLKKMLRKYFWTPFGEKETAKNLVCNFVSTGSEFILMGQPLFCILCTKKMGVNDDCHKHLLFCDESVLDLDTVHENLSLTSIPTRFRYILFLLKWMYVQSGFWFKAISLPATDSFHPHRSSVNWTALSLQSFTILSRSKKHSIHTETFFAL